MFLYQVLKLGFVLTIYLCCISVMQQRILALQCWRLLLFLKNFMLSDKEF